VSLPALFHNHIFPVSFNTANTNDMELPVSYRMDKLLSGLSGFWQPGQVYGEINRHGFTQLESTLRLPAGLLSSAR